MGYKKIQNIFDRPSSDQNNPLEILIPKDPLEISLSLNFDKIKKTFGHSSDIVTQEIIINETNRIKFVSFI